MYEPRRETIDLKARPSAGEITEGMKLAVAMDGTRRIYRVDDATKTRGGYHLDVTLLEVQSPTS